MTVVAKAGARFRSTTCTTEVVVVRAPASAIDLRCGGRTMVPQDSDAPSEAQPVAPFDGGSLLGKRYVTADGELELLCTKSGDGSVSLGEKALDIKGAKPLPSSD